ncbi:transposase [Allochromatium palmeri]|uniref:transposase n=1 Tax=Allochromatium palmeri TaxID=231048 RepID=UPI003CCD5194
MDFATWLATMLAERGPHTAWHLIMDNLNIHCSESLVRLVAEHCGLRDCSNFSISRGSLG